jgi:hypothetical protein
VATVTPMQHPDGGFGGGHGHAAHSATSYAVLLSLVLVGGTEALDLIDRKAMFVLTFLALWRRLGLVLTRRQVALARPYETTRRRLHSLRRRRRRHQVTINPFCTAIFPRRSSNRGTQRRILLNDNHLAVKSAAPTPTRFPGPHHRRRNVSNGSTRVDLSLPNVRRRHWQLAGQRSPQRIRFLRSCLFVHPRPARGSNPQVSSTKHSPPQNTQTGF